MHTTTCNITRIRFASTRATTVFAAILAALAAPVRADLLTTESVAIQGSGGSGGSGTSASDMIYAQYNASDGWGWAGGAGAVQGNLAITNNGGYSAPANEAFSFVVGPTVAALNATYGADNWTITDPTLTFTSSYSVQNNSRFGIGSGTYEVYWVSNDNWSQSKGTLAAGPAPNPIYATSEAQLLTWTATDSDLGPQTFTVPAGGSGYVDLSDSLAANSPLVSDIVDASTSVDPNVSLYLMSTSNTLGMIIFTGGQSQPLPTLNFDVVAVPEPSTFILLAAGAVGLVGFGLRRRKAA